MWRKIWLLTYFTRKGKRTALGGESEGRKIWSALSNLALKGGGTGKEISSLEGGIIARKIT